jgi:tRNA(Ile)-lysidine synthase
MAQRNLGNNINTIEKESVPGWHTLATRSFVLTAHHADDNIETIAMNFFRGTGLHGLTGIPISGPSAVLAYIKRPLLPFSKKELIEFANENKLEFVEDSSNLSSNTPVTFLEMKLFLPSVKFIRR